MVVFLLQNGENTYPKGRALLQKNRVYPQTKKGNLCDIMEIFVHNFGLHYHFGIFEYI